MTRPQEGEAVSSDLFSPVDEQELNRGARGRLPISATRDYHYSSTTFTAAFAGPKSIIWTPTAFDGETK